MRNFKIPKVIRFPGGYVVEIIQLPTKDFRRESGSTREHKASTDLGDVIYLDLGRTLAQRRADFLHEYLHNALDWQAQAMDLSGVDAKG